MGKNLILSLQEARAIACHASRLDGQPKKKKVSSKDLYEVLLHLGMIQLDTISVITRAHETAIFSRLGNYDLSLWQDLFREKKITEYLAHAAAIVPTQDIPLMKKMMEYYRNQEERWVCDPHRASLVDFVLQRISSEGALCSRSFDGPSPQKTSPWESWYGPKPERRVLANLWAGGELLISLRDPSFARWFDLPERILSEELHHQEYPENVERNLALKSLGALGITKINWLSDYYRTGGKAYLSHGESTKLLKAFAQEGICHRVDVEGMTGPLYLFDGYLPYLDELRQGRGWPRRTTFLSPFDNLIFNRRRMKELWNMDYTIEIYTPAEKRVYGYYTMPILHQGNLIGRMDPSLSRKEGILRIKALHLEKGVKGTSSLAKALATALVELKTFLGAREIILMEVDSGLKEAMQSLVQ